jgi:hypothetical protein
MRSGNTWLVVFAPENWDAFVKAGGAVVGFKKRMEKSVDRIKPGDRILAYVARQSVFVSVLEVVSTPYFDTKTIWDDNVYPCRIRVRSLLTLPLSSAVLVYDLKDQLTPLRKFQSGRQWGNLFRNSPKLWLQSDADAVWNAMTARVARLGLGE